MQGQGPKMAPEKPPVGWGNDEVTQFLEHARNNSFASFANLKGEYQTLTEVSACFHELGRNLDHHEEVFVGWFVCQSLSPISREFPVRSADRVRNHAHY